MQFLPKSATPRSSIFVCAWNHNSLSWGREAMGWQQSGVSPRLCVVALGGRGAGSGTRVLKLRSHVAEPLRLLTAQGCSAPAHTATVPVTIHVCFCALNNSTVGWYCLSYAEVIFLCLNTGVNYSVLLWS